jgi:hypothetical protein
VLDDVSVAGDPPTSAMVHSPNRLMIQGVIALALAAFFIVAATAKAVAGELGWFGFQVPVALFLAWLGLYWLQVARSVRAAHRLLSPAPPVAFSTGTFAPKRFWLGRSGLLAITDRELLVLQADARVTPLVRSTLAEIKDLRVKHRSRSTLLEVELPSGIVAINTSGMEASEVGKTIAASVPGRDS